MIEVTHPAPRLKWLQALPRTPAMDLFLLTTWLRARSAQRSERGANLVEYLLLLAFIAIIVMIAVQTLGGTVSSKFSSTNTSLQ